MRSFLPVTAFALARSWCYRLPTLSKLFFLIFSSFLLHLLLLLPLLLLLLHFFLLPVVLLLCHHLLLHVLLLRFFPFPSSCTGRQSGVISSRQGGGVWRDTKLSQACFIKEPWLCTSLRSNTPSWKGKIFVNMFHAVYWRVERWIIGSGNECCHLCSVRSLLSEDHFQQLTFNL